MSEKSSDSTCYQPVITASCDPTAEEVTETSNETKMNRETVKERIAEVRMSDPESLRRTYRELIGVDAAFRRALSFSSCSHSSCASA